MSDKAYKKLAQVLVDHSTAVQPGERVAIETTINAAPIAKELYEQVLVKGGHPHMILGLPEQEKLLFTYANDEQLSFVPTFQKIVTDQFEVYIRVRADIDPRSLSGFPPQKQALRQRGIAPIRNSMLKRGATNELRWVLTQIPTEGYAKEAGMSLDEYTDFVFRACHVDDRTSDPVAHWKKIGAQQIKMIERIEGHDLIKLVGPNVNLSLSVKGRKFNNSHGLHNLPDGEIYTGPVEDSATGWVKFTYPAIYQGQAVEGVELGFEDGRVASAKAAIGEELLKTMIESDAGSHYLGEFAIGTNYEIDRFTHNILFDEKLGGTFHMALGMGYPETGSMNRSSIHWDMICDLRRDSEIQVDGEVVYREGKFI